MMSIPVKEPPSKRGVGLIINCNRTTTVINILLKSVLFKSLRVMLCLVAVAFLGHPALDRWNCF